MNTMSNSLRLVLGSLAVAAAGWAAPVPGSVLSYFQSNQPQVYGLSIQEDWRTASTMMYLTAQHGTVYRFDVDSVSAIKNGGMGTYDSSVRMTNEGALEGARGLAVAPCWEGPYGTQFFSYIGAYADDRSFRSRFDIDGSVPNSWATGDISQGTQSFSNNGNSLNATGDIEPVSRTAPNTGLWATYGNNLIQYPDPGYGIVPTAQYGLGEALNGVALGAADNDVWVLTVDKEILHVLVSGGLAQIATRFNLDSQIVDPQGIVFDTGENSLWVSDLNGNAIYQVAIPEPASLGLLVTGGLLLLRRRSRRQA
jgi:hypothetical protein